MKLERAGFTLKEATDEARKIRNETKRAVLVELSNARVIGDAKAISFLEQVLSGESEVQINEENEEELDEESEEPADEENEEESEESEEEFD